MRTYNKYLVIFAVLILTITGCSEQNNDQYGSLKVYITDAPFPIDTIESAEVLITKVDARINQGGIDSSYTVLSEDSMQFNLLELRNGITEKMIDLEIPAGELDLVRLYVQEASLKIKGGEEFIVKVPSGAQTGIKVFIDPALTISGGLTSELILDFNLEQSFVLKGNMDTPAGIKGFNFKPVIRAANRSTAGSVAGIVTDSTSAGVKSAAVWIEQDTLIASAITDSTGYYAITALPAGAYTLSAYKETYDTVVIDNIVINAADLTIQDIRLTGN